MNKWIIWTIEESSPLEPEPEPETEPEPGPGIVWIDDEDEGEDDEEATEDDDKSSIMEILLTLDKNNTISAISSMIYSGRAA